MSASAVPGVLRRFKVKKGKPSIPDNARIVVGGKSPFPHTLDSDEGMALLKSSTPRALRDTYGFYINDAERYRVAVLYVIVPNDNGSGQTMRAVPAPLLRFFFDDITYAWDTFASGSAPPSDSDDRPLFDPRFVESARQRPTTADTAVAEAIAKSLEAVRMQAEATGRAEAEAEAARAKKSAAAKEKKDSKKKKDTDDAPKKKAAAKKKSKQPASSSSDDEDPKKPASKAKKPAKKKQNSAGAAPKKSAKVKREVEVDTATASADAIEAFRESRIYSTYGPWVGEGTPVPSLQVLSKMCAKTVGVTDAIMQCSAASRLSALKA